MSFARSPRCLQRLNTKAKQAIKVPIKVFLRKEHFMTRINVLASVLYRKSVSLKNQNFNKLIWNNNRNEFVSSLSAMQFLVACIGLKNISHSQAEDIISVLHIAYDYKTEEFSDLLREASDESDYSDEYEDVIFQMHLILSKCINSAMKKEKGYILTVSSYIKAFHNLPRAFLSITDKSRISPSDAIEYSKSYLKLD